MYGPDTALEHDPTTGQWGYRSGGKYFPVGKDEQPPGYVTWDGQLEAAFKQIDLLMEQLHFERNISCCVRTAKIWSG